MKPTGPFLRNYLRVRGEYERVLGNGPNEPELPPRARRILAKPRANIARKGTTSACAENTQIIKEMKDLLRNYLRVRGEYLSAAAC